MALLAQKFLNCVVAIGGPKKDGNEISWKATGFLYGNCVGAATSANKGYNYEIFLVTNRHVLKGKEKNFLRFNPKGGEEGKQSGYASGEIFGRVTVLVRTRG